MTNQVQTAAESVAPEVRRLTAKEFLALPKDKRPKLLRERLVTVHINEDVTMDVTVKQLTKAQTALLNKKVLGTMPEVPVIPQEYTTMHTDPLTGKPRRPGTYKEQNPDDPKYKQELEVWFNDACVWLALLSAAEDLGVDADNMDSRYEELAEEFPPTAMLQIAVDAARVNEGINLADQLLQQVATNEAIQQRMLMLEELEAEVAELRDSMPQADAAPVEDEEK